MVVGTLDAHAQGWDAIMRSRLAPSDLSPALRRIQHLVPMTAAAELAPQKPLNPGAESSVLVSSPASLGMSSHAPTPMPALWKQGMSCPSKCDCYGLWQELGD